jgi:1,4-alpha-glucan branching enzyme
MYRLNWSRTCGAQKSPGPDGSARLRFGVWAPNARQVAVCIANVWKHGADPRDGSLLVKTAHPVMQPHDRCAIAGGYVAASANGPGNGGLHHDWTLIPLHRDAEGFWWTDTAHPDLQSFAKLDHIPYMFRVVKDSGAVVYRTDLYSRCQIGYGEANPNGQPFQGLTSELDGSVSCSVVVDPDCVTQEFLEPTWPERHWLAQDRFFAHPAPHAAIGNQRFSDFVIYELHIGALGAGTRGANKPGTLQDALALLDYLQELGVNAVELLPLSEFGGGGAGWGYATSHYFALEYAGGGRDQYKWFIRECHARGIAVILDVVYNHYSHDAERAEWMYDTDSHDKNAYYWYESRPDDYAHFNNTVPPQRRGTWWLCG